MDQSADRAIMLLPARATKTIYFVRHGEVRARAGARRWRRAAVPPAAAGMRWRIRGFAAARGAWRSPWRLQGWHNVAGAIDNNNYKLEKYFDAHLTELGWEQARAGRARCIRASARLRRRTR